MPRLILMRHAKSGWDDPRLDDIDRPLNARGQRNAVTMGAWLKTKGYIPDQVLLSSSIRTRETLDRVTRGLGLCPNTTVLDALYLASEHRILSALKKATGDCVLLIAHNPGIGEFAADFASHPPLHPDFLRYPTAATAVFDLKADNWEQARFGENEVIDFATPRELEAET
ncbi:SixA phosphatase family protein [Celeribacter halophilus]|uniref:Phosphohistidine phosphatase n=1 Tax=Celeribacter halophilus TaxID=576117 RepID=A0A1I3RTX9_9RHOB|nr:histidine phosphatase family protein [Celeribacter halophilus]PZX06754.1 phosphohistidine phosphatase [Celeribacter halophilus]SFJ49342.1 phosphohistidine phosphatase [Celeribacter halophilus]